MLPFVFSFHQEIFDTVIQFELYGENAVERFHKKAVQLAKDGYPTCLEFAMKHSDDLAEQLDHICEMFHADNVPRVLNSVPCPSARSRLDDNQGS